MKTLLHLCVLLLNIGVLNRAQAAVLVTSPNGGESLTVGTIFNITWTGVAAGTPMLVDYTIDGVNWIVLDDSYPSTGSYAWTVPNTPSGACKVAVYASSTDGDLSDGSFQIVSGVGISEIGGAPLLGAYPNPSHGRITLMGELQPASYVHVYSAIGDLVYDELLQTGPGGGSTCELGTLERGTYQIVVRSPTVGVLGRVRVLLE